MRIVALVVARNAGATLGALLDHLAGEAVPVVLVDHGSTDDTWEIAKDRIREPVRELLREPYTGVFDLGRQLRLRRQIIGTLEADWVLNLDADEFLFPPDPAETLRDFLRRQTARGRTVVPCNEFVFLPASETEVHRPESFRETMTRYVCFQPRNRKQRAFRPDVPLAHWMATGGHTVLEGERGGAMSMLHYVGLSLDHIRAQYLARVFALEDFEHRWHGTRRAATAEFVVAPPEGALLERLADRLTPDRPVERLPIFAPASAPARPPRSVAGDLVLSGASGAAVGAVAQRVAALHPGLRVGIVSDVLEECPQEVAPHLHVLCDGRAALAARGGGLPRQAAALWCHRVARLRQQALGTRRYGEIRLEDLADREDLLPDLLARLLRDPGRPVIRFPRHRPKRIGVPRLGSADQAAFEAVAGPLLRDLGYGTAREAR